MALPKEFIMEFHASVPEMSFMGIPVGTLTRRELQATVVFLMAEVEEKKEMISQIPVYKSHRPGKGH